MIWLLPISVLGVLSVVVNICQWRSRRDLYVKIDEEWNRANLAAKSLRETEQSFSAYRADLKEFVNSREPTWTTDD